MKTCSKCGETKNFSEFYKHKNTKDGHTESCKSCIKQYQNTPERKLIHQQAALKYYYKAENKLKIKKYQKDYQKQYYQTYEQKPEHKLARKQRRQTPEYRFGQYKYGAKKRGYNFELTIDQFNQIINQPCKYCGADGPNGVDRVDNNQGYTLENSAACCSTCNDIKSDRSVKELYAHILKMIKHSFKNWRFNRV